MGRGWSHAGVEAKQLVQQLKRAVTQVGLLRRQGRQPQAELIESLRKLDSVCQLQLCAERAAYYHDIFQGLEEALQRDWQQTLMKTVRPMLYPFPIMNVRRITLLALCIMKENYFRPMCPLLIIGVYLWRLCTRMLFISIIPTMKGINLTAIRYNCEN